MRCKVATGGEPHMNTTARADAAGLSKAQRPIQIAALVVLSLVTLWTLYMVPSWQALADPFLLAAVAGTVTVACLWLTFWLGPRAMKFERGWLAAFLVGMPLIYVTGWFVAPDHAASSWLGIELVGLAIYAGFAVLGWKSSSWSLL
jgi:hypothetical protein